MKAQGREEGRTCLGCRGRRPRGELIRIVAGPDGAACFDLQGRLPGRGAWVCPAPGCVDALSAGALRHVLQVPVALPAPAARRELLTQAIERRLANLLTIARRMRAVVFGPTGVRAALAGGRATLLILAADLDGKTAAGWERRAGSVPLLRGPDAATLGELAGRTPVSVAACADAGLSAALSRACELGRAFWPNSCDNAISVAPGTTRTARGSAAAGGG